MNIGANARWVQNAITVAGGNGKGDKLNQLHYSHGIFVDDDQTVYIADSENHRIVEWKNNAKEGRVVAGGNGEGSRSDQLNYPTNVIVDKKNDCVIICDSRNKRVVRWSRQVSASGQTIISAVDCHGLAIDHDGYLYVSDIKKDEVTRWRVGDTIGKVVAGGNGRGNHLNQLNCPYYIFFDQDRSIYVSDWNNHRIMKWIEGAKEGIVIAGGQGKGASLKQFSYPRGIVVDQSGTAYVTDNSNGRIMRWSKGSAQGSIIVGENGKGNSANQISGPTGLSIDSYGNLYVLDSGNNRVQKFNIDPSSIS
jgi:sugar lactone lactonase YvrE